MRKRKKSVLLFLVLVLILSGCGTKSDVVTITNVSYDPTREFYESYTVARRLRQSGEVGCGRV